MVSSALCLAERDSSFFNIQRGSKVEMSADGTASCGSCLKYFQD